MKVYYDPAMAGADTGIDTTRKSALIAASLADDPIPGAELADISPAATEHAETLISQVHDLNYVRSIVTGDPRGLAESSALGWSPGTYRMAVAHTAGVVAAVGDALDHGATGASLSSGIHHARRGEGAGYCTFNAFAAVGAWLTIEHPDARLVILDLDAHFGGGTHEMILGMPNVAQVDVSTNDYDRYHSNDAWKSTPAGYRYAVTDAMQRVMSRHPDIVIFNAGMDPFDDGVSFDDLGWRDHTVATALSIAEVPAVVVLAGGYTSDRLSSKRLTAEHRSTLRAFA